ncbi:CRISPR-associated endonuclease Cas2 [Thermospira aquatica]|uniref:CRISPR-associated endoribonuclease Cas2 n=1 Tax=Thermospira aquatica TaxID=2828656 RepID=A0AAX3BG77_9SPIR|nr:CRISPR-associated endonuclease Cas2 [Thermospira aquatica]URA11170.1 CRISPR-associated endonuclease Cas2 [Thermospira aquatica]
MIVYIVYDIESTKAGNRRRNKIVKKLETIGLYRIQKSVFVGNINKNEIDEMAVFCERLIKEALKNEERDALSDKIYIFPVSQENFENVRMIGEEFDKDMVSDKIKALII